VYLATDLKHRREVALKVLLPGLAAFLGTERFLKEIQIAAGLTHPHILALYDSGEAGGFLYYVMPYVDGGSAPVADALSYAHRLGILHRDVKPENIQFSQGHPVVADFGIAKVISTAGGANLTRSSTRKRAQELERLTDRLAALAQELTPPPRRALPGPV
jgi:serine/threonine-protein kinase